MISKIRLVFILLSCGLLLSTSSWAQSDRAYERMNANAINHKLDSLANAVERQKGLPITPGAPKQIPNYRSKGRPANGGDRNAPDALLQSFEGQAATTSAGVGFDGASNWDNQDTVGFRIAPPDTDGSIGPSHYVQMINLVTTIFNRDGSVALGPFASDAIWDSMPGRSNCKRYNQGDPIVLYDEKADRWLFSQFAFPDSFRSFSQCVAISQSGDPTGGYNTYEFSFTGIGFNDYPKHGIVDGSITMMANIFEQQFGGWYWGGTFLGVMDKDAMYNGQPASLLGLVTPLDEFGFVAGDLDYNMDGSGSAPALFGTAMSNPGYFDIWQLNPNWNNGTLPNPTVTSIQITAFDDHLCNGDRGACIPQNGGPLLESLSDRLMHRLQIRDLRSHKSMVASHTVDADGNGLAGIRWYEFRDDGGGWILWQEGTYAPSGNIHRWMPSIAMNEYGDIGIGFLFSSSSTYMSIGAVGQTAAEGANRSGLLDSDEMVCIPGGGPQTGVARSGDYSSTSVDPLDGRTFWHTNEYVATGGNFVWDTYICPFTVGDGGGSGNQAPTADIAAPSCDALECSFDGSGSSDPENDPLTFDWDYGDGAMGFNVGPSPIHPYQAEGSYLVELTVSDAEFSNSTFVSLDVDDEVNQAPSASIDSASCNDLICDFIGSGSDPDPFGSHGTIASYNWDFGGDGLGSGTDTATPSFTYDNEGTYFVTLTVTDGGGLPSAPSSSVEVNPTEPPPLTTMHVASILVDTINRGGGNKSPRATVVIHDNAGNPVPGATVTGDFHPSDSGTENNREGITNGSGSAAVEGVLTKKGKLKFTFCVSGVTNGLTYDPVDNALTCQSN